MGNNWWDDLSEEDKERLASRSPEVAEILEEEREVKRLTEEASATLDQYNERVRYWRRQLRDPVALKRMQEGNYKPL